MSESARTPHCHADQPLTRDRLRSAVALLCSTDSDLDRVVNHSGAPPLWFRPRGFATLVRIILEQQVSLVSASRAYERLQVAAGRVTPANVSALGIQGVRRAGITRQKAAYCVNLAGEIAAGTLNLRSLVHQEEACIRAKLLELPGVGDWTVDIYLLMALRKPDIWPGGDLALAKAMQEVKQLASLPTKQTQLDIAAAWSPYRSVAVRILWHHYLSVRRRS